MARTALTLQEMNRDGIIPSYAAANSDGNKFPNDSQQRTFLHVKAASADVVVTIQIPGTVDGQAITDRTVTVTTGNAEKMIGPFPARDYNQPSDDGQIYVDYDTVTGVTVAAVRV